MPRYRYCPVMGLVSRLWYRTASNTRKRINGGRGFVLGTLRPVEPQRSESVESPMLGVLWKEAWELCSP
jgi:hypothetical protein